MIPGIAADQAVNVVSEIPGKVRTFYADFMQWLESEDSEIKIASLAEILYASGIPQGAYLFLHDLHVLERQIMNYIASLGADIKTAESDLSIAGQEMLRVLSLGAYGGGIQP